MRIFFTINVSLFTLILSIFLSLVVGYLVGYFLRKMFSQYQVKEAEEKGRNILKEAEREAENCRKSTEIEIREAHLKSKADLERKSQSKIESLNKKAGEIRERENEVRKTYEHNRKLLKDVESNKKDLDREKNDFQQGKIKFDSLMQEQIQRLERIGSFTSEQAKTEIKNMVMDEARLEAAKEVKEIEGKARSQAEDEARRIISIAVQRVASDHVAESSISVVEIENDEIKGRIIGREGRNIRALEQATGIDLIIDDTPGAVVLSGFDPIRREVARKALEKLTADGRIHPVRIEETVSKCKKEIQTEIAQAGEQAVISLGISNVHPDMVKLLGRLKYRTSYTQNVLEHVQEVAWVCGSLAAELGLDEQLAKRAGLFHDIGKSVDHQTDGTHTQLGVDIAKKYNEHKYVINSIAAHHEDVEPESPYAILVCAGDTISASRPGARREILETYVKRMGQLEEIGDSFEGVQKTFAIQAGREVRIIVTPESINDEKSALLAKDVAKRIEKEVTYPGEVRVTVLRESRFTQYAR